MKQMKAILSEASIRSDLQEKPDRKELG